MLVLPVVLFRNANCPIAVFVFIFPPPFPIVRVLIEQSPDDVIWEALNILKVPKSKFSVAMWLPKLSPDAITDDWGNCIIPPVRESIANKFWLVAVGTTLALICARGALLPDVMTFFQLGIICGISRLVTATLPPTSHN